MKTPTARVSARTDKMDFSQTYGTKYCIPNWLRDEQIRLAIKKVKGRVVPYDGRREDPVAVVGYGPSLQDTVVEVGAFKYIISCSGAHRFLIDRGIIPTWHMAVDPLPKNTVQLIGEPHPDVEYLISSTCHPDVLDHLENNHLKLWHVFTNEEEGGRILPPGEWMVTGGADVGLRSLVMARLLGFTNIHVFGIDGSGVDDKQSHAGAHPSVHVMSFRPGCSASLVSCPALDLFTSFLSSRREILASVSAVNEIEPLVNPLSGTPELPDAKDDRQGSNSVNDEPESRAGGWVLRMAGG